MTGIGVLFAYLAYTNYHINHWHYLLIGFITGYLGSASSMMINDYVDRFVDAINKPWKPIPSGRVKESIILYLSILFLIMIPLINTPLGLIPLLVATTYALIGYSYSFLRKHWWSHFIVSTSTTGPIIYGYVLAGMPSEKILFTILFSTTIFLITSGREVLKAIMDIRGDKEYGYITIPIRYGVEKARKTYLALGLTGSIIGVFTGFITDTSTLYKVLIVIAATHYTYYAYKSYMNIGDREILEKTRKNMLYAMMTGLTAFWVSSLPF